MKVFKYPIDLIDHFTIQMPFAAQPISFQLQDNVACMWALVDDTHEKEPRNFIITATGQEIKFSIKQYIGTVVIPHNKGVLPTSLVWHLFEVN